MAILNRLRQLRANNDNMSQAQLARETGISRQTLIAIERGQRLPSLEVAHRLADALDRDLVDVFHYESEISGIETDDESVTIVVWVDDDPEWWKSDNVSRVTTRA